jgi:hypothetical protein
MKPEQAATLALKALQFLLNDQDRAGAFLAQTGLSPGDLRRNAADPAFLAGVMDYLLTQEELVVSFAADENLDPGRVMAIRRALPGGDIDF